MKIGIISDIHGYPEQFKKAMKFFEGCDMILCAGDVLYHGPRNPILDGYNPKVLIEEIKKNQIPMIIAKGNCEAEVDGMVLDTSIITEYIVYEKDGVRFIVNHGHNLDDEKLHNIGSNYKANVVITGHTHVRKYEEVDNVIYMNPGSVSVPKEDNIASIAVYENGKLTFINVENGENINLI